MTPAKPLSAAIVPSTDAGELKASGQSRRGRRAARKRPHAAPQARPEDKSALLAFAYAEYHRRLALGQAPAISQWAAQFPICRSSLRQVLQVEQFTAGCLDHHSFLDPRAPSSSSDESIHWPFENGQRGDFTIVRELARGAFARVYLATEASTGGRLVVLKCSLHGDAEARTLGRLAHPNIVPILSARIDDESGLTLVCMPYRGSATLEDVLDHFAAAEAAPHQAAFLLDVIRFRNQPEDPPPPAVDPCLRRGSYADGIIHLAVQLAETLAYLHQHGVCHRDLKPSNVLLDPSGKPLLLDFNLAESGRETLLLVGGTLRYMAPEQIRAYLSQGKDGMDERVDFYSLGVMVYELLGGVHPCESLLAGPAEDSQAQTMLADLQAGFRPFREVCPELAPAVAAVLDRCVALDVGRRPRNAAELTAALQRQFEPAHRLHRWFRAQRRWLPATMGLLLVALSILAFLWAIAPPYSQREYERGRIAYQSGNFAAAETHFDKAIRAELGNARFRYARGCARLQQSKYQPPDLRTLDQIGEDLLSTKGGAADARTLAIHAYLQARKQQFDAAIGMYNACAETGYRPVMVLNNRAYCFLSRGQLDEAQNDVDRVIALDPHCQAARYNRARLALRRRVMGKISALPSQTLADVEEALQSGPTTSALYRDAAVLYGLAAQDEKKPELFERALSYLRQALAGGCLAEDFQLSSSLTQALKRPEFASLLERDPLQATPQPELRLLDPVEFPD